MSILDSIPFVSEIKVIVAGALSAGAMFVGMSLYDAVFDDPAVRREARKEMVAKADYEALKVREDTARKMAAAQRERAERLVAANTRFAADLADANQAREDALNDLEEQAAGPAPDRCVVDDALLERLRNK